MQKKIKKSVRRVFSETQLGPASSRIPDKLNLNIDRSKLVLRPECLAIMTSVSSESKLAGSKIKPRKQISTSKLKIYISRHGYIPGVAPGERLRRSLRKQAKNEVARRRLDGKVMHKKHFKVHSLEEKLLISFS